MARDWRWCLGFHAGDRAGRRDLEVRTVKCTLTRSLCLKSPDTRGGTVLGTVRISDRSLESLVYR